MKTKDTIELNAFNKIKMPKLKGHVKLTLHNPTTGKTEKVEGENIITNAVADIFRNNYLGGIDYSKLMPLWSVWYGGILCYENAFTVDSQTGKPDPNDYFIQGNDINMCVAHAGGTVIPTDHDDDLLRGSPTTSAFQYSEHSVKQVWEWLPSHGNTNRNISALSLTHANTGDAGTGANTWAFQNFNPFADITSSSLPVTSGGLSQADNICTMYDENHGLFFNLDSSNWSGPASGLVIHIRKLPYTKAGLFETLHADTTYEREFTVTLSFNLYCNPCYWFDYENKKLWIFSNMTGNMAYSKTTLNYAIIDCEAESVDSEGTIVSDDSDLMCIPFRRFLSDYNQIYNPNIVREGNYFYFPTSSGADFGNNYRDVSPNLTGYKKINITNQADQTLIPFSSVLQKFDFSTKCGGLLITNGNVVNGSSGYPCSAALPSIQSVRAISQPNTISTYATPLYISAQRYILANKMVNTSKWNLPTPVQKTASQAMSIEYTITEVDPDEE